MLSYQHVYHAGNRADIHKHTLLARVLDVLTRKDRPLTYMETHAGRGLYDLASAEARKTGEAEEGWLGYAREGAALAELPASYIGAVQKVNEGAYAPLYPGSPLIAAHILRAQDHLHLMELHPQEHAALEKVFGEDRRVHIHRRDGLEGVLALAPPTPRRGLVLVDPSYEIKTEYEVIPAFVVKLLKKWPEAGILVWAPVLAAGRHDMMLDKMRAEVPSLRVFKSEWPGAGEGMQGSIMAGVNLPYGV